jgi:hypothetical protein
VKLHSKLVQNVREGRMRRHAKLGRDKLFKHNNLIIAGFGIISSLGSHASSLAK